MGEDESCVLGVSAVFVACRLAGDRPPVSIVIFGGRVGIVLYVSVSMLYTRASSSLESKDNLLTL